MKEMLKRLFCLALVAVMLLGMMPVHVEAFDEWEEPDVGFEEPYCGMCGNYGHYDHECPDNGVAWVHGVIFAGATDMSHGSVRAMRLHRMICAMIAVTFGALSVVKAGIAIPAMEPAKTGMAMTVRTAMGLVSAYIALVIFAIAASTVIRQAMMAPV